jgi:hypothetical protein
MCGRRHSAFLHFLHCLFIALNACRIGVSYFDLHTLAESTGMEWRHE